MLSFPFSTPHLAARRCCLAFLSLLIAAIAGSGHAFAHGSLENGRMLQVRLAGPNGHAPAPWNDSYYTWNQNSQNFPGYASPGFRYSATVPDGTLACAGINDGVQSGLNFSGLNNPSANWQMTSVAAGAAVTVHWLATATHDPSHFQVYLTRAGVNPDTKTLAWADLESVGSWAVGNANFPVAVTNRPNPVSGGTMPSYDWNVPVPADRSGHVAMLVIWQRDDPAGEAFFAVQDLSVSPAAATTPVLAISNANGGVVNLDLLGVPGHTYDLQATDSLNNPSWVTISTGSSDTTGHWLTSDPNASTHSRRFYRAVSHP